MPSVEVVQQLCLPQGGSCKGTLPVGENQPEYGKYLFDGHFFNVPAI